MDDILANSCINFVYDDWPEDCEFPNANRPKHTEFEKNIHDNNSPWLPSYVVMQGGFPGVPIKNHRLDSVIKTPKVNFFYHVWHRTPLYNNFLSKNLLPLDEEVIDVVRKTDNLQIIFANELEVDSKKSLNVLNNLLLKKNISPSKVWVINNNQKLLTWKEELGIKINVHSSTRMPLLLKHEPVSSFKEIKDVGSFFLCHNRSPRAHRYALLSLLKYHNILYDTNWSLINGWQSDKENFEAKYHSLFLDTDLEQFRHEILYFESIDMFKSKYETNNTNFDTRLNQIVINDIKTYENSYVNLVTETNFEDTAIHISEKSLKPFYYLQFPLILASYEHNKYLKKCYGFDLFEDIIDYRYDSIRDNRERLFAYIKEVDRIHQHKEYFITFYKKNKDRFIKNYELIKNYTNANDYNFFERLYLGE